MENEHMTKSWKDAYADGFSDGYARAMKEVSVKRPPVASVMPTSGWVDYKFKPDPGWIARGDVSLKNFKNYK